MSNKIRVAVIGTGQRGPSHARELLGCDEAELALVCDLDEERAKNAAENFNVKYELDHREVIARNDIDALAIATHTRHHAGVMRDAAAAGKPFLVEKPYCDSIESGVEICELAEKNNVVAMVGYQSRLHGFCPGNESPCLTDRPDTNQCNTSARIF